ncbi:MAG TPA: PQQ-binding-like beta-propeller repeat protein, partial [Gemmataceae bacterium]|nr:PQQ-binding-like beta-propeller repeat protein [Gemmataceae bacterium]
SLRRGLAAVGTVAIVCGILAVVSCTGRPTGVVEKVTADVDKAEAAPAWPLFGGSLSRNMVNTTDKNLPTEWSIDEEKPKNIKWTADLGSKAYGGPIIADGKIFVGTNNENPRNPKIKGDKGIVMCFRESDGKFLWQAVHDKLEAGRVQDWPQEGVCSTPVVEGKRLYYVSNRCELVCADTEGDPDKHEAKFHWKLDMIKTLGVFPHNLATCSPLIIGDNVFVVTSNGVDEGHVNLPRPQAASFIAVNKKSGEVVWKDNSPGTKIMHGQWSNPVCAKVDGKPQIIFPGGDGWLRGFEPDSGKLIWKFDCNPKKSVYRLGPRGTRNDFLATPVVYENRVYIGVGQDPEHLEAVGHFWCIDLERATRLGAKNPENDVSPVNDNFDPKADVNKNSALAWHFGGPAGKDAAKLGRNYYFGRTLSTAAVHDGLVYVADLGGYFFCFDAKTSEKYWEHAMNAQTWSSPYWVDGKIYMGNDSGKLLIFKHGKTKELVGEIDMESTIRATPTVVNGVLYVMTEHRLYAIAAK